MHDERPIDDRFEEALRRAIDAQCGADCPPRLAAAMRHGVFPAGARVRPRLLLAVADAFAAPLDAGALDVAVAIELMHGASLVQDDLPCFDDAATRRAQPSVHAAFDERLAILASDGLIMAAYQRLAEAPGVPPRARLRLVTLLARHSGSNGGITGGQAWESEARVDLERYHAAKTGALFAACTEAGAVLGGAPVDALPEWAALGARVGAAYQIADDLKDATGDEAALGKPVNVDARLERPNATRQLGLEGATQRLRDHVAALLGAIPPCRRPERLQTAILVEAARFMPVPPPGVPVPPPGVPVPPPGKEGSADRVADAVPNTRSDTA